MGLSAVMRGRRDERNLTRVAVNQGGAGTTVLKAAQLGRKHALVGGLLTLSADGTLAFGGGAGTGAFDIMAKGGFAIPQDDAPLVETNANEALTITTTGGAARGVVLIETSEG